MTAPMACVLLLAAAAAAGAASPPLAELREEADRILRDLDAGKDEAVASRFVDEARARAGPAIRAIGEQRKQLGSYLGITDARLLPGVRLRGEPLIVLDADVRYANDPAALAELAFVKVAGAWRLRGLNIAAPVANRPLPSDATAPAAARTILQDAQRMGLGRLVDAMPAVARDKPDAEMRAVIADGPQALLGGLRGFELGEPEFAWYRCRKLSSAARFEHGSGTILFTLCPHDGGWRPFAVDVEPDMTAQLFEKTVRLLAARALQAPDATVKCPPTLTPVGGTVTCRLTAGGRTRELRVHRTGNSSVEAEEP